MEHYHKSPPRHTGERQGTKVEHYHVSPSRQNEERQGNKEEHYHVTPPRLVGERRGIKVEHRPLQKTCPICTTILSRHTEISTNF